MPNVEPEGSLAVFPKGPVEPEGSLAIFPKGPNACEEWDPFKRQIACTKEPQCCSLRAKMLASFISRKNPTLALLPSSYNHTLDPHLPREAAGPGRRVSSASILLTFSLS